MQHEHSESVAARVVAWHNRHPLATRIAPVQVHSVGVVSLPFAVRGAVVEPLPLETPPAPEPAAPAPSAPEPVAAATDDGAVVELVTEPDAVSSDAAPTILDRALDAAAAATVASPDVQQDLAPPSRPPEPAALRLRRLVTLPPRPRRRGLRDGWQWLRQRSAYRALFTEDFIAPLSPRRVAAWAADHGSPDWPLEPEAPLRLVMLDPARRRGDGAPELDLHLITAAIAVGDQRLRVLLAPGDPAAVIGSRHWNRGRLAATAAPLAMLLLAAFAGVLNLRTHAGPDRVALAASGPAASVASAAASAVASAAGVAVRAPAAASAAAVSAAASAAPVSAAASDPVVAAKHRPAPTPKAASSAVALAAAAASAPEPEGVRPPDASPRRGRIELPPLVPRLVTLDRQALRQAGLALRGPGQHAVPAKAWALATRPQSDRRQSERAAAQLQALALVQRLPMRAELMHSGGAWRAVFWPFGSAADAEKVRLALADKGLRTEVIEF